MRFYTCIQSELYITFPDVNLFLWVPFKKFNPGLPYFQESIPVNVGSFSWFVLSCLIPVMVGAFGLNVSFEGRVNQHKCLLPDQCMLLLEKHKLLVGLAVISLWWNFPVDVHYLG